jgi:hypothetical protein
MNPVFSLSHSVYAVFIGTTRNSFNGKAVKTLEYQAYSKLAIKVTVYVLLRARCDECIFERPWKISYRMLGTILKTLCSNALFITA